MVEKILNNTTPYGKIRASHEGALHSSTLNRLCVALSSMSLFLYINITQIEVSVTLFAFVIFISQFLENDMFSIEMDPRMLFVETRVFTSSSVIEYL